MKKILIKFCLAFICFFGFKTSQSQIVYPLTGHPRLFFLSSDEVSLKSKLSSNPTLSKVHNVIIEECNKMLTLPFQQRVVTGGTMITISREAFRRIGFLCYAYRMIGDTRYAARAESEMLAMAAFPDWNPSNQLDFTEMTMAMAIGYDWLYNYLGQDSRLTIANAIKQKGIEETIGTKANKYFLQDKREIYSNVNSIQVGNASISAGVAAVYDEDPAYYQPLIDRAINLIKFPMGVYQYNGAYPESVMYWEYGTTFNIFMIDLLQRMWNTDRDLLKMEGFLKTSNFALQMHGTATKRLSGENVNSFIQQVFNFGDGYSAFFVTPAMFWLAEHAPEQSNLSVEMKKLDFALSSATWSLQNNRFLPFLLIWSRNLSLNNLLAPVENTYIAQGLSAVAAIRTGWSNNDIFLAMKGGSSSASHSHMDAGSFVMDAMDVRWAMDFGGGSALTISNRGHNTLTINGNNQLKSGYATVGNLINTPDQKSVDVDMTSIYENDAVSCKRTGAIISNRYVEIKDVIQAGTVPLNVKWNLLTEAVPVKVSNKIFLLTQSTKKLYMIFQGTNQVTAQTWSTNPDNLSVNPFPGTIFTGFEFSIPPGVTQTVTVKLVPEGDPVLNELLLSTTTSKQMSENHTITAFFDEANCRICVTHLPESAKRIKLFDPVGRLLNDVRVYGDFAMLECNRSVSSVLIVQVILADGSYLSAKVLR